MLLRLQNIPNTHIRPRFDTVLKSCQNGRAEYLDIHTEWSKKVVPRFYFCDNFRKCSTPILTIFLLLQQEMYDA